MSHCLYLQTPICRAAFTAQNAARRSVRGLGSHQRGAGTASRPAADRRSGASEASTSTNSRAQRSLPAAYYRGGTSRAVFFRRADLPADPTQWDEIFRGAIGSPDPHGRQLDGLGGGISSLSKVCVVGPAANPSSSSQGNDDGVADVDYTFAALGVRDATVDYSSNCGNMSSAVGPFAVDAGLVQTHGSTATVRIRNTNTGKLIRASFPVVATSDSESGTTRVEAAASGDYRIDGVASTAARVRLDFLAPGGSRTGKLLPTGRPTDEGLGGAVAVRATLIDVGNPCCFVLASDLGVAGTLSPEQIDADAALRARLEAIRREAAVRMGLAATVYDVPGSVPKIAFVSAPHKEEEGDIVVRAMSVGQPHKAIPVTVALAVAAASKIPGTTVAECVVRSASAGDRPGIDISHASGKLNVDAVYDDKGHLEAATVFRTARRLMEGRVFWK